MTKWLTKFKEEKPVVNNKSLQERIFKQLELRLEYNRLLTREQKAEQWMDDPDRTDEEIAKWMPLFNEILGGLNKIIDEIGLTNCTAVERLHGFNVIPLLGNEVDLDKLPQEWGGANDRNQIA